MPHSNHIRHKRDDRAPRPWNSSRGEGSHYRQSDYRREPPSWDRNSSSFYSASNRYHENRFNDNRNHGNYSHGTNYQQFAPYGWSNFNSTFLSSQQLPVQPVALFNNRAPSLHSLQLDFPNTATYNQQLNNNHEQSQGSKQSTEQRSLPPAVKKSDDKKAEDSLSSKLSQKASNIINSILKGDKSSSDLPDSSQASSRENCDDIVARAETLCQNLRIERARAKEVNAWSLTGSEVDVMSSSASSKPSVSGVSLSTSRPRTISSSQMEDSISRTTASSDTNRYASHRILTSPKFSSTVPLKDCVKKMLQYPKSRRGATQIEKLLKNTSVPVNSRQRLLSLMPSEGTESFTELAPEVQKDILAFIDEVFDDTEVIDLSDDTDVEVISSPVKPTKPAALDKGKPTDPSISSNKSSYHFEDIIPHDEWQEILNSAGLNDISEAQNNADKHEGNSSELYPFPAQVRKGLSIVDKIIRERREPTQNSNVTSRKSSPCVSSCTPTEAPIEAEIPQAIIFDVNMDTAATCDGDAIQVYNDPLDRCHSVESILCDEANNSKTQNSSVSVINDANIICIKPEVDTDGEEMDDVEIGEISQQLQHDIDIIDSEADCRPGEKRPRTSNDSEKSINTSSASNHELVSKRPKVASINSDGEASMMEQLYDITIDEEEVRKQISNLDQAIEDLMLSRQRLKEREIELRERRLNLLKGARGVPRTNTVVNEDRPAVHEQQSSDCNYFDNRSEASLAAQHTTGDNLQEDSVILVQDQSSDTELKTEPDTTSICLVEGLKEDTDEVIGMVGDVQAAETTQSDRQVNCPFSVHQIAENVYSTDSNMHVNSSMSTVVDGVQMNAQYLGTFSSESGLQELLKKMSENFSKLKQVSSVPLKANDEIVQTSNPSINLPHNKLSKKSQNQPINQPQNQPSNQPKSQPSIQPQNQPKKQLKNQSSNQSRNEVDNELPSAEAHSFAVPDVPLLREGTRTSTRLLKKKLDAKLQSSLNSASTSEDDSMRVTRRNRKSPVKDKETSRIMKEYLHCSSSSDVELTLSDSKTANVYGKQIVKNLKKMNKNKIKHMRKTIRTVVNDHRRRDSTDLTGQSGVDTDGKINSSCTTHRSPPSTQSGNPRCGQLYVLNDVIDYIYKNKKKLYFIGPRKMGCLSVRMCSQNCVMPRHQMTDMPMHISCYKKIIVIGQGQFMELRDIRLGIKQTSVVDCGMTITALTAHGGKVYIGFVNGTGAVYCLSKKELEKDRMFLGHESAVLKITLAQEGARRVLICSNVGQPAITVRDANTNLFIRCLLGHAVPPKFIEIKNHLLYSGGNHTRICIHNTLSGDLKTQLIYHSKITALTVDVFLFVGEERGQINIHDIKNHDRILVIYTDNPVRSMSFHLYCNMLYYASGIETKSRIDAVLVIEKAIRKCQMADCSGHGFVRYNDLLTHIRLSHIQNHLASDSATFKCKWSNCDQCLDAKSSEDGMVLEEHMKKHAQSLFI